MPGHSATNGSAVRWSIELDDPGFNVNAYAPAAAGQFGNVGRNTIVGPGQWNLDMALWRSFPVTERQSVQLRLEAFNVFNHARFGPPNTTLNSPSFGQILSAADPRILQLAVRYLF